METPTGKPHVEEKEAAPPSWSLRIGSVAGIPIRIHITFWLLLIWVAYAAPSWGRSTASLVGIVLALFGCIVLHELGHALVAKAFGIKTRDITLYPIGGISSLPNMGKPVQELAISIAGPAVNVVIAIVLALPTFLLEPSIPTGGDILMMRTPFLQSIFFGNLMLAFFNIIPAFPMDGGRILRSALAIGIGADRATRIAARIGQGIAIALGLTGLIFSPWLMFIAFFIFLGAGGEAEMQRSISSTTGYHMRDAMITRFETISHGDSLAAVVDRLLRTNQEDFPVTHGEQVLGILTRRRLLSALASDGKEALVAGVMEREFPRVGPGEDLTLALQLLKGKASSPLLVFDTDRLIGMVTLDNLVEFLSVARAGAAPARSEEA